MKEITGMVQQTVQYGILIACSEFFHTTIKERKEIAYL